MQKPPHTDAAKRAAARTRKGPNSMGKIKKNKGEIFNQDTGQGTNVGKVKGFQQGTTQKRHQRSQREATENLTAKGSLRETACIYYSLHKNGRQHV